MSAGSEAAVKLSAPSAWSPFRSRAFAVIWTATVVSNIGGWMSSAASGWLMTGLDPNPLVVSMVQVASTLPMFLFALPAGALADIVDRRKFLIVAETGTTIIAAVFAAFVWLGLINPLGLLGFTFLLAVAGALTSPAWQSVVTQLVAKQDLQPAIAANSAGVNVSRAIGPALSGVIVAKAGIAAPFWLNAVSNLGIVGALLWWRPPPRAAKTLPVERFTGAIRAGFRHALYNGPLRSTLYRGMVFYLFASAYWALLPLVARKQIAGGPDLYGFLLGTIGVGAVAGTLALPKLKAALGPDRLVAAGSVGTAAAMILFGLAREPIAALLACLIAGLAWIAALSSLNVSAQVALPEWVRSRGLAIFITIFFGSLSAGSALWGQVAGALGLPVAHFLAAAGILAGIPLTWRWKLQTGAGIDLTPSMHWPVPIVTLDVESDRGPVLVTVEYQIDPKTRPEFLAAIDKLSHERRRDGAYSWAIFEDIAVEGRMVETFHVDSWLEHMRQHQRVTNADRVLQDAVLKFHCNGAPKITHLIASEP